MKRVEIIIPHGKLADVHDILKDVNAGGMSYFRIEGSGKIKADPVSVRRRTAQTQPEYISRTKVEAVIKDDQVEELISKLTDRLGGELGVIRRSLTYGHKPLIMSINRSDFLKKSTRYD